MLNSKNLQVQGNTDSEWAFALFLDRLSRGGTDPNAEPGKNGFGYAVLRKAMLETIAAINGFIKDLSPEQAEEVDTRSLLNFAVTDGYSVVCTRYVSSVTDEAASLYFSSGTSWKEVGKGEFRMERRDKGADIVLVASEPLTFERGMISHFYLIADCLSTSFSRLPILMRADNWVTVPTNSTLTIHKQTVMIHPIEDEYYYPMPSHNRSSEFAMDKGLVSTAPGSVQKSEEEMCLERRLEEVQKKTARM